jgi:hypothetical protein
MSRRLSNSHNASQESFAGPRTQEETLQITASQALLQVAATTSSQATSETGSSAPQDQQRRAKRTPRDEQIRPVTKLRRLQF